MLEMLWGLPMPHTKRSLLVRPIGEQQDGLFSRRHLRIDYVRPGTRTYPAYGRIQSVEEFRSSYGLAPNYRQKLTAGPLEVTAVGPDGEERAIELPIIRSSSRIVSAAAFIKRWAASSTDRRILAWRRGSDKTITVATPAALTGCIWLKK